MNAPSLPSLGHGGIPDADGLQRISSHDVLEPGQYWRVKTSKEVPDPRSSSFRSRTLHQSDLHLISKLFVFEGVLHSVTFLEHPRDASSSGSFETYTLLVSDFLETFEPVPLVEAKAIRAAEQAEVMSQVTKVQEEMKQAQENPLALPSVQEAAKKAVEEFEQEEVHRVQSEVKNAELRAADLRRIHRRAARRSEAKGNPLAVRKATISDRLDVMISEGVTSEGVRELQLEAGRRIAIARATSTWLTERSRKMGEILKRVTPFFAEQGQLALAGASSAIDRVTQIERGITSLRLYTGDGIDVVSVREGPDAPTHEPLNIMQQKLAMDEELAVWVDVEADFDCTNKEQFFQHLSKDERLLQQILPTPRCVVSMQVTRRIVSYDERMSAFERVARNIQNKLVFLLVRNGRNVHVVYSSEPSHEAAVRLFPTDADLHEPFRGIDGANIGLQDVAFGKASGDFDDQALHYRRFLILLCGLDHRMNLFGEFFPPEEKSAFMSQGFQQRYFRFVEDDDPSRMIGGLPESVHSWMKRHNGNLRSGSRVVVTSARTLTSAVPHVRRSRSTHFDTTAAKGTLIAASKGGALYLPVPTINGVEKSGTATAWLTGPNAYRHEGFYDWYLCLDRVKSAEIHRFIQNRAERIGSIAWILTLRRAVAVLEQEELVQAPLRAFLRRSALEAQVQTDDTVEEAIDQALATWRADHRGMPAPALTDKAGLSQLLSLIFPADQLAQSLVPMVQDLCVREGIQPLMLSRTGKNQYVLYSVFPLSEREPYSSGVAWGWVRRHLLKVGHAKASLGSQSSVWLMAEAPNGTEEMMRRWPELDAWLHAKPEPCKLSTLAKAKDAIFNGQKTIEMIAMGRDQLMKLDDDILQTDWIPSLTKLGKDLRYSQRPYLWVPLGLYQAEKDAAPLFLYAMAPLSEVLTFASDEQRAQFARLAIFSAQRGKKELGLKKAPSWSIRQTKALHLESIELEGQLRESSIPKWATVKTHERGGIKRSERFDKFYGRGTTRAQRRSTGGDPQHESTTRHLSLNRALDTLMGKAPHPRRAFYKTVDKRVRDIWFSISSNDDGRERREQERRKRFEPSVPFAFDLAECLWDATRGRSMANSFFRQVR